MSIFIFGPPGSGKGSQCHLLEETFGYLHVSSGDLLRHEKMQDTERGRLIQAKMTAGDLVPDEIVIELVREKIGNSNYYILDGMPRNLEQVNVLTSLGIIPSHILILDVNEELLIDRLEARRICPDCPDAVYNLISHSPKVADHCDYCGQTLVKRPDDCKETIRHRLDVYHKEIAPILSYYYRKALVLKIPVLETIELTFQKICSVFKQDQI